MKNIIHKLCEKESSASIKRWIREADKEEIDGLILDINARYEELYPNWDISYVALPKKDVEERKRILAFAFHMSEHYGQIEEITKKIINKKGSRDREPFDVGAIRPCLRSPGH